MCHLAISARPEQRRATAAPCIVTRLSTRSSLSQFEQQAVCYAPGPGRASGYQT